MNKFPLRALAPDPQPKLRGKEPDIAMLVKRNPAAPPADAAGVPECGKR
jgi:hypothetical protein